MLFYGGINMQIYKWHQAGCFLVQPTTSGKLVFEVPSISDEPNKACLFYDGNEHALLYRNEKNGIVLDYVNPAVRSDLKQSKEAFIMEFNLKNGDVKRSYPVGVKTVEKINIQFEKRV